VRGAPSVRKKFEDLRKIYSDSFGWQTFLQAAAIARRESVTDISAPVLQEPLTLDELHTKVTTAFMKGYDIGPPLFMSRNGFNVLMSTKLPDDFTDFEGPDIYDVMQDIYMSRDPADAKGITKELLLGVLKQQAQQGLTSTNAMLPLSVFYGFISIVHPEILSTVFGQFVAAHLERAIAWSNDNNRLVFESLSKQDGITKKGDTLWRGDRRLMRRRRLYSPFGEVSVLANPRRAYGSVSPVGAGMWSLQESYLALLCELMLDIVAGRRTPETCLDIARMKERDPLELSFKSMRPDFFNSLGLLAKRQRVTMPFDNVVQEYPGVDPVNLELYNQLYRESVEESLETLRQDGYHALADGLAELRYIEGAPTVQQATLINPMNLVFNSGLVQFVVDPHRS
jgi:hypothetical protein